MSNSIAPGSSADVNVKVTALTTNPNVPVTYKTIIFKKNLVNGVNTLTQEMMSATNIKYVIKYDYVLDENITVPANCILEFDGGSIKSGGENKNTIIGNKTTINSDVAYNIFNDCIIKNFNLPYIDIRWFGAEIYDPEFDSYPDCSAAFSRALESSKYNYGIYIYVCGSYYLGTAITTDADFRVKGSSYIPHIHSEAEPSNIGKATKSIIFVDEGITAFTLHGRYTNGISGQKRVNMAIENIVFRGMYSSGSLSSKLFYVDATGSPSRPGIIRNIEASHFAKVLEVVETNDSELHAMFGNLTIDGCCLNYNTNVIYCSDTCNLGFCNLAITNSILDHNSQALHLATYGNLLIDNNILEESKNAVVVRCAQTTYITITNNYCEFTENPLSDEDYVFTINSTNKSVVEFRNNSYTPKIYAKSVIFNYSDRLFESGNLFKGCVFNKCADTYKATLANIDVWCGFDSDSYPYVDNMGYISDVNIVPPRILENVTEEIELDNIRYANFLPGNHSAGVGGLPTNNSVVITQRVIANGNYGDHYLYLLTYNNLGNPSLTETNGAGFIFNGDFVIVLKASVSDSEHEKAVYPQREGTGYIYYGDISVYHTFQSTNRVFDFPVYVRKNTAKNTAPYNPQIGSTFFNKNITPNKPLYFDGSNWIDELGNKYDNVTSVRGSSTIRETMSLSSTNKGVPFFDETNNKYVFWNGSIWSDLDGSEMSINISYSNTTIDLDTLKTPGNYLINGCNLTGTRINTEFLNQKNGYVKVFKLNDDVLQYIGFYSGFFCLRLYWKNTNEWFAWNTPGYIMESGTFTQATAVVSSPFIDTGFKFFCTSGASIDGGTTEKTNIPIFWTGSGWVDANGNNVVAKS